MAKLVIILTPQILYTVRSLVLIERELFLQAANLVGAFIMKESASMEETVLKIVANTVSQKKEIYASIYEWRNRRNGWGSDASGFLLLVLPKLIIIFENESIYWHPAFLRDRILPNPGN